MVKVSVIVPVYNPGENISECIASLLDQSLAHADYEVIYVDDGSTDATPARLDALAAEHEHVRVEHIENSGWPGRPRNVGLEMARGEFVYFVDNDDWIDREALERMHAMAVADEADIVIGKVVGHGKYVPPGLFRENRHAVSVRDAPLVALLSPHKLFRRAFLDAHGLRFPEGRRRLEDHVFVLRAYFATDCVSVLADHPCYHWMRRGDDNASSGAPWDPVAYYAAVREVLDIVDEHTEPGPFRDQLYLRWYRAKTLGRVGGSRSALTTRPPEWQRAAFDEVRSIVLERFGEHLDERLPVNERRRAAMVRAGDFDAVLAQARYEKELRVEASLDDARRVGEATVLRATLRLRAGDEPLDVTSPDGTWAQVLVRSLDSMSQDVLPATVRPRLEDGEVLAEVEATLDPRTAAAGAPLAPGDYDHPVVLNVGGFVGDGVLRRVGGLPVATRVAPDGSARVRTTSGRAAGLALARRMPRLARAVKRAARR
ncbi:MAG: glycosyltransferase family 2 protein [Solirubrobacteraceae bacterium]